MTNEEAIDILQNGAKYENDEDFDEKLYEARQVAIEALKAQPCEDCVSRQAVLDGVNRYIYKSQSTGTQDDFCSFAELVVKALPSVTPKQRTLDWIPVKDPYSELPKKDKLWVTRDEHGYRWVDTVYYDMTEWSDEIHDVVAYAFYEEPEPWKGESE